MLFRLGLRSLAGVGPVARIAGGLGVLALVSFGLASCSSSVETHFGGGGDGGNGSNDGGAGNSPSSGGGGAGGGGGIGTTSSQSSNSSSSISSTSSVSTTSSTSTGGVNACEQACSFAGSCGIPQGQCASFLDCNNPQGECAADCVNEPGTTCNDLFQAAQGVGPLAECLASCQSSGTGGSGAGGGGNGGDPMQCQQCAQNQCQSELFACFQAGGFQGCQAWIDCVAPCQNEACLDACTATHPAGAPVQACLCSTCASAGCGYTCD